ncbi:MAG: ABC transporter permease [Gemmatimonadota bacterium]|nr:MAG: ABC transporter permease [Gemmatimonadota bacterium]
MASLSQDFRYALRLLRRSPGFTAIAALTIALGVGPTTTIFSVANSLLIRTPPGVRDPGSLVTIFASFEEGPHFATFSYHAFEAYRDGPNGLADIAALEVFSASLSTGGGGEPELVTAMLASAGYFDILGTRPALGRFFLPEEDDVPGAGQVVVLGHRLWRQRLGADSSIVGKTLNINRRAFTVIGVAEEGFQGNVAALEFGLWIPITMREPLTGLGLDRNSTGITAVARLEPGRSTEQAMAAMSVTTDRLAADDPDFFKGARIEVVPYSAMMEEARVAVTLFMVLLLVVSGIVLLIASVNVASMFLARATGRTREMAVRLAIGAGRARLVRQLVVENVLLFVLGGSAGVLITYWATGALSAIRLPVPASIIVDFTPDLRVLGFALTLALGTGILFGLAPALQLTRQDITTALKGSRGDESRGGTRLRNAFVIAQVAGSVILLAGAGMFLRALARADSVELGFDPQNVRVMTVDLSVHRYSEPEIKAFYDELEERATALPGVRSAALTTVLPLGFISIYQRFEIPGREPVMGDGLHTAYVNTVSPAYFETLKVAMVAGRGFDARDRQDSQPVVVINQTAARQIWPGESALGKQISDGRLTYEVVGIAADGKYQSIGESRRAMIYRAFSQAYSSLATLVVRTPPGAPRIDRQVRELALALDADLPVQTNAPYTQVIGVSLLPSRAAAGTTGVLGGVALALAAAGLLGVLSYAVSRRTREIGIRIALGADAGDVYKLVMKEGARLTAIGLAIGLPLAFAAAQLVRSLLFGLSPADPVTLGGTAALFIVVGLIASYLPAARATRTDPMYALRAE